MRPSIGKLVTGSAAAAALLVCFSLPAPANAQGRQMNRVQHRQLAQIHQGLKNGSLSKQQATKLAKQERDINAAKTKMNSSGNVTPADRAAMRHDVKREEKSINSTEKSNREQDPPTTSTQPPL